MDSNAEADRPGAKVKDALLRLLPALALAIAVPVQCLTLNCLCHRGPVTLRIALAADLVVALGILRADRRSKPRLAATILCALAPFAVTAIVRAASTVLHR
jgi:hypothetical protein